MLLRSLSFVVFSLSCLAVEPPVSPGELEERLKPRKFFSLARDPLLETLRNQRFLVLQMDRKMPKTIASLVSQSYRENAPQLKYDEKVEAKVLAQFNKKMQADRVVRYVLNRYQRPLSILFANMKKIVPLKSLDSLKPAYDFLEERLSNPSEVLEKVWVIVVNQPSSLRTVTTLEETPNRLALRDFDFAWSDQGARFRLQSPRLELYLNHSFFAGLSKAILGEGQFLIIDESLLTSGDPQTLNALVVGSLARQLDVQQGKTLSASEYAEEIVRLQRLSASIYKNRVDLFQEVLDSDLIEVFFKGVYERLPANKKRESSRETIFAQLRRYFRTEFEKQFTQKWYSQKFEETFSKTRNTRQREQGRFLLRAHEFFAQG